MKIFIPLRARGNGISGGWQFTSNIIRALKDEVEFVNDWKDCDIYFIPGPTLTERDEVKAAKEAGKKIVTRVDNIPRNSRNRNTGTPRLYDFCQMADKIIYQSEWAKDLIQPFVQKDGEIILNGVDTSIFNPVGEKMEKDGEVQYLYSQYSSDPVKMWVKAWYDFQRIYFENNNVHLWIVGREENFGSNQIEYNFDFFGGAEKKVRFLGLVEDREKMARIYRGADYLLAPNSLDACSNVVVEAYMSGCKIIGDECDHNSSTNEILEAPKKDLTLEGIAKKYMDVFERVVKK